jgi:ATP-dependent Clp protease ATP-binding subunit ClpA
MPKFSRSLEQSLHLALVLANERHHEYATLEHLLLALVDDQDAAAAMRACNVDIDKLRRNLVTYVESELEKLVTDGSKDLKPTAGFQEDWHAPKWDAQQWLDALVTSRSPRTVRATWLSAARTVFRWAVRKKRIAVNPTAGFQRTIQRAVIHVQSSGREEVTGANVLVAIFAERESHAAFFLQEQEMTRYDAVNYISHGITKREEIKQQIHAHTIDDCLDILEAAFQSPMWEQLPQQERIRLAQLYLGRLSHIMEIVERRDLEE